MEFKSYIPRTEPWKDRKAEEAANLFWAYSTGSGQEIDISADPFSVMEAVDDTVERLGIGTEDAHELRVMVSEALEAGPRFDRGRLLMSYGDEEFGSTVEYL